MAQSNPKIILIESALVTFFADINILCLFVAVFRIFVLLGCNTPIHLFIPALYTSFTYFSYFLTSLLTSLYLFTLFRMGRSVSRPQVV